MNIFVLGNSARESAKMHCDKHCVKMILEYSQMLSSAHRVLDGDNCIGFEKLYRVAHKNHPCTIWVRENKKHYRWLFDLWKSLSQEYTLRYGKFHASWTKLNSYLKTTPKNIPDVEWREPPQCMPDYCKDEDVVKAYRNYYILEKNKFAVWKYSVKPDWYTKGINANI